MIIDIGNLTGKPGAAQQLVKEINNGFDKLQVPVVKPKAAYIIWKNPWMTVGGDTFIHSMMDKVGFKNLFKDKIRYPQTEVATLAGLEPDYVLLSTEPFPFKHKDVEALQCLLPQSKLILVDGEMFSWYGSRMVYAAIYFQNLHKTIKTA